MASTPRVAACPRTKLPAAAHVAAGQDEGDGQRQADDEAGDHQELEHVGQEAHAPILRGRSPNSGGTLGAWNRRSRGRRGRRRLGRWVRPVDRRSRTRVEPPGWTPGVPSVSEHLPSLVFGAALPIGVYFVVRSHVQHRRPGPHHRRLVLGGLDPDPVRAQARIDFVGAIVLVGFAVGVVSSTLLGGNAYVLKVRDAFFTALFGVACIVTIYTHDRPALFYVSRYLSAGKDPSKVAAYNRLHELPIGRHTFRVLSVVWGIGLVIEASARMVLAEVLHTSTFIAVSPFITATVIGSLFAFTVIYSEARPRRAFAATVARDASRADARRRTGGPTTAAPQTPFAWTAPLSSAAGGRRPAGGRSTPKGARMADEVLRERRGNVEILTINRPEARNAINGAVSKAMSSIMDELADDPDCWVVVITGSGDKAFSAGMDLKAFSSGEGGRHHRGQRRLRRPHPARLPQADHRRGQRVRLAGGFEIMLSCDLVVAADHATFGIPEAKRGLIAGAGGLIRMPKRLPMAIALEMAMTGDPIDAERAYALGLVNKVVPAAPLLDEAIALAERIAANAPLAVRYSKNVMKRAAERARGRRLEAQHRGGRRRLLLGRRHGGPDRVRREARRRSGRASSRRQRRARPHLLAPALDTIRLTLHVLAATVWVGGQLVMAGLVGPARTTRRTTRPRSSPAPSPAWPGRPTWCCSSRASGTSPPSTTPTGLGLEGRADGQDRRGPPGRRRRLPAPAGHVQGPAGAVGLGRRAGQRRRAGHGHPAGRLTPNTSVATRRPRQRRCLRVPGGGNGSNLDPVHRLVDPGEGESHAR